MATPFWIRKMLELRGVSYQEFHHSDAFTAQELAEREHWSGHRVAKVVVVLADGHPVELILPASRRVVLRQVADILDAGEVRLASEEEMHAFVEGCEPGAPPALRYLEHVPVLMDSSLGMAEEILFQAGTHHDAIKLRFADWNRMVKPRVEFFTEPAETVSV